MCVGAVVGAAVGAGVSIVSSYYSADAAKNAARDQIKAMRDLNNEMIAEQKKQAEDNKRMMINTARDQISMAQRQASVAHASSVRNKITAEHKVLQLANRLEYGRTRARYNYPSVEDVNLGSNINNMFY